MEASAGTGKTYSIAMLVLRFVAELGVPVEELLVVTYTRAATEELRGRIRTRLVEARALLTQEDAADADPVLLQWRDALIDIPRSRKRLESAILNMDLAPIFTIHSFCQRMLQEQALESGQLFDMELCADVSQVRKELVDDFWRSKLYDLSNFHCALFLESFTGPAQLYDSVSGVGAEDRIEPATRIPLEEALQDVDECRTVLTRWWQSSAPALKECFVSAIEEKMFKKNVKGNFSAWWKQCQGFFSGVSEYFPADLAWLDRHSLMDELNGSKLRGNAKKTAFLEDWPLADGLVTAFLLACERASLSLRIELALELQNNLRRRLNAQGLFSFDDLVLQLAGALSGDTENDLQRILSDRFQVALIDEFQDTDAAQYTIFSTLFGTGTHYLYLIGDPKQAIYKFRGADIYAYFDARQMADYHLNLSKNYRSNPLLVDGVNTLFLHRDDAFACEELSYHQVAAAKAVDTLCLLDNGEQQAATIYCSVESPADDGAKKWSSGKCMERQQSYVASEIEDLLLQKTIVTDETGSRSLRAGDIAILVRSHKQAAAFQQTLAYAGIPSVISSRITVFETEECRDLQGVLEAVAVPSDFGCLRKALSCKWFGMDGQEFYAVTQDDEQMDVWMERFYEYHKLWQEKGVLAMMNALLAKESVFEILCKLPLADRQITNINHLCEVLQEEETNQNLSVSHSLQYLAQQRVVNDAPEHAQLRLESDADAVKIVTMHGVKGLEFPVVFCPSLWYRSARLQHQKQCIVFHDAQNKQVADLGSDDFAERREQALEEELAEEMRLLYVAVTRASCRSYLFWADVSASGYTTASTNSALGWVLGLSGAKDIGEQNALIQALCEDDSVEFRSVSSQVETTKVIDTTHPESVLQEGRSFSRFPLLSEWLMTSYSALAGSAYHSIPVVVASKAEADPVPIYDLPFGAGFGNVVHAVLEDYPFAFLAGTEDCLAEVEGQCRRFGVTADPEQLASLIKDVVRTPLRAGNGENLFALADLQGQDVLKEMGFYFHLREESTARINELLAFSQVVSPIQEKILKGYLTGFVDLVCRWQGKYYVIDYKSNYLGDFLHDYKKDRLVAAMHDHNYGLQYWIYTLVLHRFLMGTLADYKYEESFGGVFYLFARGMHPEHPGNGVFFDRPKQSVLDALQDCLGGS